MPVCGHRAVYLRLGLVLVWGRFGSNLVDFLPDPCMRVLWAPSAQPNRRSHCRRSPPPRRRRPLRCRCPRLRPRCSSLFFVLVLVVITVIGVIAIVADVAFAVGEGFGTRANVLDLRR